MEKNKYPPPPLHRKKKPYGGKNENPVYMEMKDYNDKNTYY